MDEGWQVICQKQKVECDATLTTRVCGRLRVDWTRRVASSQRGNELRKRDGDHVSQS